jgi:hypothetical protein
MTAPDSLILLVALGAIADEVAATLRAGSHTGTRTCHGCPVAAYLRAHGVEVVGVSTRTVTVRVNGVRLRISLPAPVRAFLRNFDGGRYPELLAMEALP